MKGLRPIVAFAVAAVDLADRNAARWAEQNTFPSIERREVDFRIDYAVDKPRKTHPENPGRSKKRRRK